MQTAVLRGDRATVSVNFFLLYLMPGNPIYATMPSASQPEPPPTPPTHKRPVHIDASAPSSPRASGRMLGRGYARLGSIRVADT